MTNDTASVQRAVEAVQLPNAKVESIDGCVIVQRVGSLPGSGTWTHQYGNIALPLSPAINWSSCRWVCCGMVV